MRARAFSLISHLSIWRTRHLGEAASVTPRVRVGVMPVQPRVDARRIAAQHLAALGVALVAALLRILLL